MNCDEIKTLIYYEFTARGLKWPDTTEAILFAMTELGEVCEARLNSCNPEWVRNNPEKHPPADDYEVAEELGDVIRMCLVAGYGMGHDPLKFMVKKCERKIGKTGGNKFRDIESRVINSAPCEVQFRARRPIVWFYGKLILWVNEEQLMATFGDLTVEVSAKEMMRLATLATGARIY